MNRTTVRDTKSCQPCGCDAGANHLCEQHQDDGAALLKQYPPAPRQEMERPTNPKPSTTGHWGPLTNIHDSGKRVTYASGSMRDPGEGKLKWSRIFYGPMARRWAQHLTTAEAKYPDAAPGVPNFTLIETEEEYFRYKESALRHFMSWFYEETDEDHASAVYFNVNGVEIIRDKRHAKEGR